MPGWDSLVSFFALLLGSLAQIYGGNLALAIITLSILIRLALLPLTLRMARQAQTQQRIMAELRDQIAKLRKRYRTDPGELTTRLSELYRQRGVKPIDGRSLAGGAVQALVGAGLYSAIRRGMAEGQPFLWISDLARPDAILVLVTGLITFVGSIVSPHLSEQSRTAAALLPAILTIILAWRLSSAVVLYWASSAAVNGVQSLLLRRQSR